MNLQTPKQTLWRVLTRTFSRQEEEAKWTVADQREVLLVHEAIIEALMEVGYLVRVLPVPETDELLQEWVLWASTVDDSLNIVEGMPLADAQLMIVASPPEEFEPNPVFPALEKEPQSPVPGNIMERLLNGMSVKESIRIMDEEDLSDLERFILLTRFYGWICDPVIEGKSPFSWEEPAAMWEKIVRHVKLYRQEKEAISKADDLERRMKGEKAMLEEFGLDPDEDNDRDIFS